MKDPAEGDSPTPEVVVAGSASRDLAPDDPRGWRLGGGVTYGALTLARLGLRAGAVIGADPLAADAAELGLLRAAGVEIHLAEVPASPVFELTETASGRIQVCHEPGVPLDEEVVPAAWRGASGWLLAPVAGELGDAWGAVVPAHATVALGWQGLLRLLVAGRRTARRAPYRTVLTARADIVGVSDEDLAPGTALADLAGCLNPGATLIVTRAAAGGIRAEVVRGGLARHRSYPAIPASRIVDPTGAGDVFLAAYLAAMLAGAERERRFGTRWPLRLAAAAASLAVEGPGLAGVPSLGDIVARMGAGTDDR